MATNKELIIQLQVRMADLETRITQLEGLVITPPEPPIDPEDDPEDQAPEEPTS